MGGGVGYASNAAAARATDSAASLAAGSSSTVKQESVWRGRLMMVGAPVGIFLLAAGIAKIVSLAVTFLTFFFAVCMLYTAVHNKLPEKYQLVKFAPSMTAGIKLALVAQELWKRPALSASVTAIATVPVLGLFTAVLCGGGIFATRHLLAEKVARPAAAAGAVS